MIYKYLSIGAVVLFLTLGLYLKGRSDGADKVQAKFDAYKNTAQLAYDRQVAETARIQSEWNRSKEREGEINARLQVVSLESASFARGLRDYRSRLSALSQAAGTPAESDAASRESDNLAGLEERHLAALSLIHI